MKKAAISLEFIRPGKVGGAEQSVVNTVLGTSLHLKNDEYMDIFSGLDYCDYHHVTCRKPRYTFRNRFLQETVNYHSNRNEYHAYLFPNYFTPPHRKGRTKTVAVIRDLNYIHYPENTPFIKSKWLKLAHYSSLYCADMVVSISDYVKQDILKQYGNRWDKKIVRIYNPVNWAVFDGNDHGLASVKYDGEYVLSVSAQWPHKNLDTLIKAFSALRRTNHDVELVLVGQRPSKLSGKFNQRQDITELIATLGLTESVHVTGYVDDATLSSLYAHCSLFVFPSLFEGFGRPAVEALGLGLPTLTNRHTSLYEVTKGYAHYIDDPLNAGEMADKMLQMLKSPGAYRPSTAQVEDIRRCYDVKTIGEQYYTLLFG